MARPVAWRRPWRAVVRRWPLWLLTAAVFAIYAAMALLRHRQFGTSGYDLGIFDQAVRRYAHLQAPLVPLKGIGYNIWGDHFHPIIAAGAPLYWIADDPRTLLVLQAALVASSVPVVYRFARRRTGNAAALALCFGYGLSWAFQTMINFSFHEVAWGVPILALLIDALDRGDDRWLLIAAGLLLLVREDMGAVVALAGLLRLTRAPRWPGVALVVSGLLAYEITTAVILPHFAPNGQFAYWQYGPTLGPDLKTAVVRGITRPWHLVDLFFSPWVKTKTLLLMLVPLLLLPLRSRYAWLALPLLAQRFFEPPERYRLWEPHYHYNALPWVVLVLAMIDGADRLGVWRRREWTATVCAVVAATPLLLIGLDRDVAVLHDMVTGSMFRLDTHMKAQAATVARIPRDVCVAADDRIAGHLTGRDWVTIPGLDGYRSDLIVLDLSQDSVGGNDGPTPAKALTETVGHGYRLIFSDDGLQIWQSPGYSGPSAACGPLGSGR